MSCCCSSCNRSKGSTLLKDWFTETNANYTKERFDKIIEWTEQKPYSIKLPSSDSASPYIDDDLQISWIAV